VIRPVTRAGAEASDCDCILLAAGLSSRMRGSKMLREVDGRPLVRLAAEHATDACARVIVVLGHQAQAVREAIVADGDAPEADARETVALGRLEFVENAHYHDGMFGSIQAGMRAITSEWFFVVPGDMPRLTAAIFEAVAHEAPAVAGGEPERESGLEALAVVPYYRSTRGHPVLVHRSLIPRLLAEPRSAGPMRKLLERYPTKQVRIDSPAITLDLDTDHDVDSYSGSE
jgi:molybdenum cofactor cytidylyltransferase